MVHFQVNILQNASFTKSTAYLGYVNRQEVKMSHVVGLIGSCQFYLIPLQFLVKVQVHKLLS